MQRSYCRGLAGLLLGFAISIIGSGGGAAVAQERGAQSAVVVRGTVLDSARNTVSDAAVRIEERVTRKVTETTSNDSGAFAFQGLAAGNYSIVAEKAGVRSAAVEVNAISPDYQGKVDLILAASVAAGAGANAAAPAAAAMEFADKPNFTVAGVTDWTAVGGHGSDAILRTSETLARETNTLKPDAAANATAAPGMANESELRAAATAAPGSFEANRRLGEFYLRAARYREAIPPLRAAYAVNAADYANEYDLALAYKGAGDLSSAREHALKVLARHDDGDVHRLIGDLDEAAGDPLAAVHEYEQAATLDPSEENYFAWGSELLLHRAVWQAQEVFQKGIAAYPKSSRMLAAEGAALFAGALYDEAAQRLCEASDLAPSDAGPYMFMGRIAIAAPAPMACIESKLARFARERPENPLASYFYAMAIWKRQGRSADPRAMQQVETLLNQAVTVDPKCGDAYLQLGILYASRNELSPAIDAYRKAIGANPQLGEAHYRLGVAYDRTGEPAKAKEQFQLHDEIETQQAAAVEQERREVKQFLVVLQGQPAASQSH